MTKPLTDERQPKSLANIIQWGLLIILALMPFHAFLSVWLGSLTHHQAIIQAWKEGLLLVITLFTAILLLRDPNRLSAFRQPWVVAVTTFSVIAILVTFITRPPLTAVAFGLKTDLEFLLAGIIALVVSTPNFARRIIITVLAGASLAVGIDLALIFLLPPDFLTHFGYGPQTILPYQHIAVGTDVLRFPGTLGGPNQLGTYLILPLSLSLILALKFHYRKLYLLFAGAIISLIATQSRAAWLGALLAITLTIYIILAPRLRRRFVIIGGVLAISFILALPIIINNGGPLQYFLLHSSVAAHDQTSLSDSQHAKSLEQGITSTLNTPLGHGLGTAGPATFRAGNGNIIENFYLQISFEAGFFGLLLFVTIIILLIISLLRRRPQHPLTIAAACAILGISLVSLVLPAWADSSTALIVWICAGASAGLRPGVNYV